MAPSRNPLSKNPVILNETISISRDAGVWFSNLGASPQAKLRLFCFPYAGGSDQIFRNWSTNLPRQIEVCPVLLPGRGVRLKTPGYTNLLALVKQIAHVMCPLLDLPFAFFGHSMGALMAFELSRELRRLEQPQPLHLFLAAHLPPQIPREREPMFDLSTAEIIERMREINGTPTEILDHPELMEMMMPLLRADFEMVDTYTYVPDEVLDSPITVLGGLQDRDVTRESLQQWEKQTTGRFSLRMFPGDHFFVNTASSIIYQVLGRELFEYIR
ncbi:MAG TPA: thioesterase domain-containing protein [Pyrinomonadaceae bacterium]|nr:thioesterase domain-containing protein [Pyrinomonadaceae bacterium]